MRNTLVYLFEVVERAGRQIVEPIQCYPFQTERKYEAQDLIIVRIYYHLVSKILDALDGVTHSKIIIEDGNRELPQELALQDFFGEEGVREFDS